MVVEPFLRLEQCKNAFTIDLREEVQNLLLKKLMQHPEIDMIVKKPNICLNFLVPVGSHF